MKRSTHKRSAAKHSVAKIDWDTVELVERVGAPRVSVALPSVLERRGRSDAKRLLSGAAMKARACGAIYTHAQIRKLLPVGFDTLRYGWILLMAAMTSDRDFAQAVDLATVAIIETSRALAVARLSTPQA